MTTRYATIIENEDGQEIVSTIGQFEGGPPRVRSGTVEQVADGVVIGMVRGGPLNAIDGWGFPVGSTGGEGRADTIAKAGAKVHRTAKAAKIARTKPAKPAPEQPSEEQPIEDVA
ncbi:hypothetical protein NKH24_06825 [Mesorhizobium sp. M1300]|uniref:hypothetical protein n=1 Tax=Mesorhizobium sp. M1300 TaxID=2957077 RepID=UPI00333598B8